MEETFNRVGTTLAGRYRLESFIRKGGMGSIYKGTHLELGRDVAVKIFHPHLVGDRVLVNRFMNEAKGTARLRHRNVVDIIDMGIEESGIPYFIMEFLEGESLRDRLSKFERLPLKQTADIIVQVLTGLHAAHIRNIIHRDIKPGNIFIVKEVDGSEIIKILDFGVAKFRELELEQQKELTSNGSIVGTPEFMSPEQAVGDLKEVDHKSDIYACGVVIYKCITGLNPFKGSNQLEVIQNIIHMDVPPPSFLVETIPPEVDKVVMKAISKRKDERYPDCKAFIRSMNVFYAYKDEKPSPVVAGVVYGDVDLKDTPSSIPFVTDLKPQTQESWLPGGESGVSNARSGDMYVSRSMIAKRVQRRQASKKFLAVAVIALVLIGAVVMFFYYLKGKTELKGGGLNKTITASTSQMMRHVSASIDKETGKGQYVKLELLSLPEGATVLIDGKKYEESIIELEKSDKSSVLVVEYKGKQIFNHAVVLMNDVVIDMAERLAADTTPEAKETPAEGKKQVKGKGKKETKKEEEIFKDLF